MTIQKNEEKNAPAPKVVTMGCRLNGYESDIIADHLKNYDHDDVIIVNSCAVTAEAVRQTGQTIRKLKKDHPQKNIIVTGCAAQTEPERFAAMPQVEKVVGNHEKLLAGTYKNLSFDKKALEASEKIIVNDIMSVKETAGHLMRGFDKRARAYLQIQNGCDHRCTFCIIPFGRGNSRSVPAGIIVEQIQKAVDHGIQEIVLTGVDITSWGGDLPGNPPLGHLVQKIIRLVPDLPRLRLSSVDSIEIDPDLMDIILYEKRFMPYLHLSLQSGDNMILKRMKRRHNREQAIALCEILTKKRPEIAFGADIIAGFPTETDEMFDNSVDLLKRVNIVYAHIFPFSPRQGTPAERMPQLEKNIIRKRASILRQIGNQNYENFQKKLIGSQQNVIIEANNMARCENFCPVTLINEDNKEIISMGEIKKVQITHLDQNKLYAKILTPSDLEPSS